MRSLSSSVLKWPDRQTVDRAARTWAARQASRHPELIQAAYFGSYARGNWGVGSDLDLLVIVEHAATSSERRSLGWEIDDLPVPVDILIYTEREWARMQDSGGRFARLLAQQSVWIYPLQHAGNNE